VGRIKYAPFWQLPHSLTENLVVLTGNAVLAVKLPDDVLPKVVEALRLGRPPEEVLGGGRKAVPLEDLTCVEINRAAPSTGCTLTLRYWQGEKERATTFFCPSREVRDEIYEALRQGLGRGWSERVRQVSRWTACSIPLGCLAFVLGLSAVFFLTAWQIEAAAAAGQPDRSSFLKGVVGWLLDRVGVVLPTVVSVVLTLGCVAMVVWEVIAPPVLASLRRDDEVPRVRSRKPGWSRSTWVTVACLASTVLVCVLRWCGMPAPGWFIWTSSVVWVVLIVWAIWTEKPASVSQETRPEPAGGPDAAAPPPRPEFARVGPSRGVVLPEGVRLAPPKLQCAACRSAGLMVLPANLLSPVPGYVCPKCGTPMRPPGMTVAYLGVSIVAGLILLGVALSPLYLPRDQFWDQRLYGASVGALLAFLVGGWAVKQLRLATPLGATAQPVSWKFWLLLGLISLFVLVFIFGGLLFLLFYIQVGF
jgi:hypothetical protein